MYVEKKRIDLWEKNNRHHLLSSSFNFNLLLPDINDEIIATTTSSVTIPMTVSFSNMKRPRWNLISTSPPHNNNLLYWLVNPSTSSSPQQQYPPKKETRRLRMTKREREEEILIISFPNLSPRVVVDFTVDIEATRCGKHYWSAPKCNLTKVASESTHR